MHGCFECAPAGCADRCRQRSWLDLKERKGAYSAENGLDCIIENAKRGTRAYFDVDDINDGVARVQELGGKADQPMPVPQMGWFATCVDPHGNEFGLWQNDESAPAPTG